MQFRKLSGTELYWFLFPLLLLRGNRPEKNISGAIIWLQIVIQSFILIDLREKLRRALAVNFPILIVAQADVKTETHNGFPERLPWKDLIFIIIKEITIILLNWNGFMADNDGSVNFTEGWLCQDKSTPPANWQAPPSMLTRESRE